MNSVAGKVLILLVSAFFIFTVISQGYFAVKEKRTTEEAVLYTVNEDIAFTGVIIRDEKILKYDGDGVLDYLYDNGSKITNGTHVAEVYDSEDQIYARIKYEALERILDNLERAQNPGTKISAQPESILERISEEYDDMLSEIQNENFDEVQEHKETLMFLSDVYRRVTDDTVDYSERIADLESELADLKKQFSKAKASVKANETGYFIGYVDGYEDELTMESALTLTQQEIEEIIENEKSPPDDAVGKIAESYSCRIVGIINTPNQFISGEDLRIMLNSSGKLYDVSVASIKSLNDDGDCIVVLDCDSIDEALVKERVQKMSLVFDEYTGIKIPRSAIKFRDGVKGAYVVSGENVTFKKVSVIYQTEDFVLSKNTSDEDYVLMYDQIVLEEVDEKDVESSSG